MLSMPEYPLAILGLVAVVAFGADRTGLWLKENKAYDPVSFAFLSIVFLVLAGVGLDRADDDLGFLNRDQTDEWKGWMQSEC
jgi:N-acetylneuraminate 9-O-acetyltransferase